jgi:hypothetical protein
LERQGTRIVNGLDELVPLIHADLSNRLDMSAYSWWKNQNISGGGATLSIAPDEDWTIPKYRLCSSQMFRPSNSLHVGPLFLAGNCQTTGYSASWPWLMLCSLVGLVIHALDVYLKSMGTDHGTSAEFGIIFDVLMIVNSLSPFLTMGRLYETRTNCSMALRNLLASRAIGNGVRLEIIGDPSDPVASTLWQFSRHIGHGFREMTQPNWSQCVLKVEDGDDVPDLNLSAATVATTDSKRSKEATFNLSTDLRVRVHVMSTMQHRDTLFGAAGGDLACIAAMDQRRSVFVWTGDEDPFTDDEIGRRMLKYLYVHTCISFVFQYMMIEALFFRLFRIISAKVERHHLAQTIFAAIGVRVVDVLHD